MYQLILEQLSNLRTEQQTGFASMRAEFNDRIGSLVSTEMLISERRLNESRFEDLERQLSDAKHDLSQFRANVRWAIGLLALPVLAFLVDLIGRRLVG